MDWGKAKTILIISFLLLDLFLAYLLLQQKKEEETQSQVFQLEKEAILRTLQGKGIAIPEKWPPDTPNMFYWTVSPDREERVGVNGVDRVKETEEGAEVRFFAPVTIDGHPGTGRFQEMLKKKIALADAYFFDSLLSSEGKVVYTQRIDHSPIFSSRLELFVNGMEWMGYRITYTKATVKGPPRKIISLYSALSVLVENGILREGEKVIDISAGYYWEKYDQDLKLLVPVWRVVHSRGVHYVNGFIGTVMETNEGAGGK